MSRFKAVIFDFDGVIVDSEVIFTAALREFLAEFGIDADMKYLIRFTGTPPTAIIRTLKQMFPEYEEEELQKRMFAMFSRSIAPRTAKPMNGVQAFFDKLKAEGCLCALGTSRGRDNVLEYIAKAGLSMPFDAVVTHEDVAKGKPDPETFLKAAELLAVNGIQKDEILIIEDSQNGIRAAKAAGIFVIGFKGSEVIQNTSEADLELSSYQEVERFFFGS